MSQSQAEGAAQVPPDGRIVVVGGYGAVGRVAARTLAGWFPGQVVVAGRDPGRAEAVARSMPGALAAQQLDVTREDDVRRALQGASMVVTCVEQANEPLARACLERGIHYVDISATAPVLTSIAALDGLAVQRNATAVLSVGLAPGLTNLLALHCVDRLPTARTVDLTVFVGLGERHGVGAVQWIVDHLTAPVRRGTPAPKRVRLPGVGTRSAHPFPFSDQHTLRDTLGVQATTRLCFESAALTKVVFGLRAAGVFSLLGRLGAAPLLTSGFSRLHFGGDRYVVHAAATDGRHTVESAAAGRHEGYATGIVTAHVARRLHTGKVPTGVLHIDQLVEPTAFFDELQTHGILVTHGERLADPVGHARA